MGQTISKAPQVQVREPRGSTQQEINDLYKTKASYYAVPESKWDDLPECHESLPYTPFVLSCDELLEIAALPKGDNHRTYVLSQVFASLEKCNFFVLKRNEQSMEEYASLLSEMATFFALPEEEKTAFAAPTTKQASGYLKLFFDNRTSRRDPEHRDLFQIRYGEDGTIPWPNDSFKQVATTHYTAQWNIAVTIFRLIVEEFDLGSELLEQTIANDFSKSKIAEEERKQMHGNTNTNLTLFHYYDTHNYTSTQKCMVHQDRGLVTLLPKTTVSGLQCMLNDQWYHPEAHIADDEMLVYFGLAMKHLTGSRIKSLRHRVVRQPHMERYSSPFELKPNDDAVLGPDFTFFNLVRSLKWKGIQNQVNRADSVEQQ